MESITALVEVEGGGAVGGKVSPGTVRGLNQKICGKIEERWMRPIEAEHPYVFVDGVYLKQWLLFIEEQLNGIESFEEKSNYFDKRNRSSL